MNTYVCTILFVCMVTMATMVTIILHDYNIVYNPQTYIYGRMQCLPVIIIAKPLTELCLFLDTPWNNSISM